MTSLIFAHGDCDGVCSGAIAKSAIGDADVYFTSPVNLFGELRSIDLEKYDKVVITDIAVDERSGEQVRDCLNSVRGLVDVFYIDHHPMSRAWAEDWFYHETGICSSEITYNVFADLLNWDTRRIAIYGAIGDFSDKSDLIQSWMEDWDRRSLYFFAGILLQNVIEAGRNYDYKRFILDALSIDMLPTEIEGLLNCAIVASKKEERIRQEVKKRVNRLRNLAYVVNIEGYMSKAAIYAAAYGNAPVGISAEYRVHKRVYDLSLRTRGANIDLNAVLRKVALNHGGSGGGHAFAAGARVPQKNFIEFMEELDYAIGAMMLGAELERLPAPR
ncbi:MAG TPA: DHH family phosphoesterase [Candidatus Methanoperedenaceae archaeon]|nr:DHH family phosphoesterase [Candidatus Methanoperedenaceae archaeon]